MVDVIDVIGYVLLFGFVDLYIYLCELGCEYVEDIEIGLVVVVLGGYIVVFVMVNINFVVDSLVVIDYVWYCGQQVGLVDVYFVGVVIVGLVGVELIEMGMMNVGVVQVWMFFDDGVCVYDLLIMCCVLEYVIGLGVLIVQYVEEFWLMVGVVVYEGFMVVWLGLVGWLWVVEELIVVCDVLLVCDVGVWVYICYVLVVGIVEILKWVKDQGILIIVEVIFYYLLFDDVRLVSYDGVNWVNLLLCEVFDVVVL